MACIVVKLAILVFNARMVLLFANGLFFSFFPFWQPGNCEPPSHRCLNTMPGTHQRLCFVNTNVLFSFFLLSFAAGYFFCSFFCVFRPASLASVQEQRNTGALPPTEKSSSEGNHSDGEVHTVKVSLTYITGLY